MMGALSPWEANIVEYLSAHLGLCFFHATKVKFYILTWHPYTIIRIQKGTQNNKRNGNLHSLCYSLVDNLKKKKSPFVVSFFFFFFFFGSSGHPNSCKLWLGKRWRSSSIIYTESERGATRLLQVSISKQAPQNWPNVLFLGT